MAGWLFEPRFFANGGVGNSCRHLLTLALLLPVSAALMRAVSYAPAPEVLWALAFRDLWGHVFLFFVLLVRVPLAALYTLPSLALVLIPALLIGVFLLYAILFPAMSILERRRALSPVNLLLLAPVLALVPALFFNVTSSGVAFANPRFHLPLLEEFATRFGAITALLELAALALWMCMRLLPPGEEPLPSDSPEAPSSVPEEQAAVPAVQAAVPGVRAAVPARASAPGQGGV